MLLKNIKKDYGTYSTLVQYHHPFTLNPPECKKHMVVNCQICFKRGKNKTVDKSSLVRSKMLITDYTICNQFTDFVTLTFNPKKIDRFDIPLLKSKVSNWLMNVKRLHSPDMKYILVFEKHQKCYECVQQKLQHCPHDDRPKAIHAHLLMANYMGTVTPAKNKKTGRPIIQNGKKIYNIDGWKWGLSTLSKIENLQATANYVKKYITKDFIDDFNKKRFWHSLNLVKPEKSYNHDLKNEDGTGELDMANPFTHKKHRVIKQVSPEKAIVTHIIHTYEPLTELDPNVKVQEPILNDWLVKSNLLKRERDYQNGNNNTGTENGTAEIGI